MSGDDFVNLVFVSSHNQWGVAVTRRSADEVIRGWVSARNVLMSDEGPQTPVERQAVRALRQGTFLGVTGSNDIGSGYAVGAVAWETVIGLYVAKRPKTGDEWQEDDE